MNGKDCSYESDSRDFRNLERHRQRAGTTSQDGNGADPMKTALAILLVTATTAHAQTPVRHVWLPPAQYDHAYDGKLIIGRVQSSAEVRQHCPAAQWAPGFDAACARRLTDYPICYVVMLEDKELIARGFNPAHVLRHEIGHCNGWNGNHAGGIDPRSK